jgi:hypothetical protein
MSIVLIDLDSSCLIASGIDRERPSLSEEIANVEGCQCPTRSRRVTYDEGSSDWSWGDSGATDATLHPPYLLTGTSVLGLCMLGWVS